VQDYLGQGPGKKYYQPKDLGREKFIKEYLQKLKEQLK
jgi:hypothetical protein